MSSSGVELQITVDSPVYGPQKLTPTVQKVAQKPQTVPKQISLLKTSPAQQPIVIKKPNVIHKSKVIHTQMNPKVIHTQVKPKVIQTQSHPKIIHTHTKVQSQPSQKSHIIHIPASSHQSKPQIIRLSMAKSSKTQQPPNVACTVIPATKV